MHSNSIPLRLLTHTALSLGLLAGLGSTARTQSPGEIVGQQKLSETAGGFLGDLEAFDVFGTSVAALGDLNGDGIGDLAVGASHDDPGHLADGAVWVLRMKPDGSVAAQTRLGEGLGGFTGQLDPFDVFGAALAPLGDLDGNGVPDLVVGTPRDDDAGPEAGALWILFLNPDGTVDRQAKLSGNTLGPGGPGSLDRFGSAVACLGDLDGDGVPDLAVGAPGDNDAGFQAGAVWIVMLRDDGTAKASKKLLPAAGLGEFGSALGALGDLDGDGLDELAVGAPLGDGGRGAVWLLSLHPTGTLASTVPVGEGLAGFTGDLDVGDRFGRSVASVGDLDGDGVPELAVGAPADDDGGSNIGALWLLFLDPGGAVLSHRKLSATAGGLGGPLQSGDDFGVSAALVAAAAVGHPARLAVGADRADDGGFNQGAVWVLSLQGAAQQPVPDKPNPYAPVAGAFDGVPGRPALVLVPQVGPGDELTEEPLTVTPHTHSNSVRASTLGAVGAGELGVKSPESYTAGAGPSHAATADFDGDDAPDIATSNQGAGSVSVLKGGFSAADAAGFVFDAPVEFALPADSHPVALVAADFDLDTDPDLAVAGDGGVTIFRNRDLFSADFEVADFVPVPVLTDLAAGDVDGDGFPDLVTASGKAAGGPGLETGFATLLLGAGDGTFTDEGRFAEGRAVASVLLGRFDGGPTLDALLAIHAFDAGPGGVPQGTLALYLGDGAGGFVAGSTPWLVEGRPTGVAGFDAPHAEGIHPRFGGLADLDLDGWLDALFTSSDSIAFPEGSFGNEQPPVVLTVLRNLGNGGFDVHEQGTGYVGRGVTPLLSDFFTPPDETGGSHPDAMLVWHQDLAAGTGAPSQDFTFLAALVGDSQGHLVDATPNLFITGQSPGDPGLGDFDLAQPADGGLTAGQLDVLVPNLKSNSLALLIGDGAGGIAASHHFANVDELNPASLPPGGVWVGGPRAVQVARLNDDDLLDAVSYNLWEDLLGQFTGHASVSLYRGQGDGQLTKTQYLPLAAPADVALGDIDGDELVDLLATRRTAGVQDELAVHAGLGNGLVAATPVLVPVPAGHTLAGGLVLRDLDGDVDLDALTATLDGRLLLFVRQPGGFTTQLVDLGADWGAVRSIDVGDVTGDHVDDVVVGAADGRLFVAAGVGGGQLAPLSVSAPADALGGGAVRLANLNGDGRLDVVSSARVVDGALDQAFVRALLGAGSPGSFALQTLPGLSSVGPLGALRPAVGDMNDDGATDLVLAHGDGDTLSIHLNQLSRFEPFGAGLPGAGGLTPRLAGFGYTTPGGSVLLRVDQAVGGALALMQFGTGQAQHPFLHVEDVLTELLIVLDGTPGAPGAGTWSGPGKVPDQAGLVGLELTFQAIVRDVSGSGPAQGFAVSNGLQMSIVD